jgi:hypothetical protein
MITTTTTPTTFTAEHVASTRRPVWRSGVASGLVAAVTTVAVVAVARAADVAVAIQDEQIPLLGFAQLTFVGALLGVGIAKLVRRRSTTPRRTFARLTVALTALSIVPDVIADASLGTKLVLAFTHVVAAAIIVPVIASRLAD